MKLRDYQLATVDAIFKEWEEATSTLCVLPTGTGKTQVFCEVIRRLLPKRAMVLVHRFELADQAMKRIQSLGIRCELEMAGYRAKTGNGTVFFDEGLAPVIVSTIQTQVSGDDELRRMHRFRPNDFSVLIVDEAHHATSDTWVKTIEYYRLNKNLKVLGVTATPDRADEEALGQVFETVAYDYEISDAIEDGWLVPIKQSIITIEGLDFSQVKVTAGDLNSGELAEIMEIEETAHGVVSASIDLIGTGRTIVFCVSVRQAEMYAEIFNRHRSNMADWVCGKTPKEERADKLTRFKSGEIQVMVNVGVLTEGFDAPETEFIVGARPTKSRSLYCQMVGRSTRPIPGIVDLYPTAEERRAAIAASPKPFCKVIDFTSNSGKHKLMTSADILGGNYKDEEIARAEKMALESEEPIEMAEALKQARADLIEEKKQEEERQRQEDRRRMEMARKAGIKAKANYVISSLNPFDIFEIQPERERGWDSGKQLSEKQRAVLLKSGIDISQFSYHQSKQILNEQFRRWNNKLATFKQCKLLKKHGYETKDLPMKKASELIDALAKNGWRKPIEQPVETFRGEQPF